MFCPKCGKGEQTANSFCRQCGEWLPDMNSVNRRGIAKMSPAKSAKLMLIFSIMCAALALAMAIILGATFGGGKDKMIPPIAVVFVFSILIAAWQIVNSVVGFQLYQHFKRGKNNSSETNELAAPATPNALTAADTNQFIRPSVVEHTTERLVPIHNQNEKQKTRI